MNTKVLMKKTSAAGRFRRIVFPLFILVLSIAGCSSAAGSAPSEASSPESAVITGLTAQQEGALTEGIPNEIWSEDFRDYYSEYVPEGGEIAYVASESMILDGNFNQTIFSGLQQYAFSAGRTYSYYKASASTEEAYLAALQKALSYENCRLIVTAGSDFDIAVGKLQDQYPDKAILMVGGQPTDEEWNDLPIGDNVHCVSFREQEAGYLAGYMTVLEGYRKLGFIGGEEDDGVIRYGSVYLQGIDDAAYDLDVTGEIEVSYWYSDTYLPSDYIYDTASEWYQNGTEVIFACGGSIYESILAAADEQNGLMIGVDIDQSSISSRVLTSAVKGLDRAVIVSLDDYFAFDHWSEKTAGALASYGIRENCSSLPLSPWRFQHVSYEDYQAIYDDIAGGMITLDDSIDEMPALDITVDVLPTGEGSDEASAGEWSHSWQAEDLSEKEEEKEIIAVSPKEQQAWMNEYDAAVSGYETAGAELYEITSEHLNEGRRTRGELTFDPEAALSYGKGVHCLYDPDSDQLVFQCSFDQLPSSDDAHLYLFILNTWESEEELKGDPAASTEKGHTCEIRLDYDETALFARFVPALLVDGEYLAVSAGKYPANPEALAANQDDYPVIESKKGLLLDPACLGTEKLTSLNVKRGVYNIPLSLIIGETTDPAYETISYTYNGETYYFNGAGIAAYDNIFTYLTLAGIHSTAIILNDWNDAYPELIHPLSRSKNSGAYYYAFNTEEEEGSRLIEAAAMFLAERYTSGEHGMVHDWVIANEINQHTSWNYMNTSDLNLYTDSFQRSFRIFYNAIRSHYANAKVYFSIDHDWNDNGGNNSRWFNGHELLYTFNRCALAGGNYDWGIAIHPYPDPLTRVNYWKGNYDMTENAQCLTIMNLSSLTDILDKDSFRMTNGGIRSASITELGFSSYSGEKLQAAAFAYCYYIVDNNPYIDAFLMNRQTDALEEIAAGLALGVYNTDLSEKYITDVFAGIDSDRGEEYLEFMLNILEADSLEEALSWASPAGTGE